MRVRVHAADVGGCGHYRLIWPADALVAAGEDVELVMPDDVGSMFELELDRDASIRAGRPVPSGRFTPGREVDCDVLVLQRPLTAGLVDVIRAAKAAGVAVVVETDDDFESIDPANIAWRTVHPTQSPDRNWRHLRTACELADLVVVTTPALAARYGRHGRVRIIPNYVPRSYLYERREELAGRELRVGWSGSVDTHPRDLQVTRGAVARVLARHDLKFHLIGSGRRPVLDPATGAQAVDPDTGELVTVLDDRIPRNLNLRPDATFAHTGGWLSLENYPRGLAKLDVGIVPLDPGAFNEAKSWLKGLEYAALGVPFVASPTGPYRALAELGAGELAGRPREWERQLERLVVDEDWRLERQAAGRAVARGLVIEDHADEWLDAWRAAADHHARTASKVSL
jgi:glycosyltransferase involved in cell wall biosynthesis